jgi:SNF2 family DNA or RNA helicase
LVRDTLENLKCNYRWICSGTPYATINDFWKVIKYLCPNNDDDLKQLWSIQHINNNLVTNLFRRHTRNSISEEVRIPDSRTETTFLQQSEIEKVIYNSVLGNRELMIKLCNHILVSDHHINILGNKSQSLSEIHTKMTNYYEKIVSKINIQIINLDKRFNKKTLTDEITLKKQLLVKNLDENKSKYNIFNSINEKSMETKDCPICLEPFDKTTKVVTSCAHFMCMICASRLFKENWLNTVKCPICRENISGKQLEIIKKENVDNGIHRDNDEINRWGTKMANLIIYLNKILTDTKHRVIIFSQWDNMLKLVGKVLEQNNMTHLFLNGSLYVVTSRIKKFKTDDSIRIVLLSSDRAVSGLNLTEATHIILLDTLNTTPEKSKQIEEQAIGRSVRIGQEKNIMVKRFIMEDTIEHEYYNRNIKYI